MRRKIYIPAILLALGMIFSCENDDTDFGDIINDASYTPREVTFSTSPADVPEASIPAGDEDYVENNSFSTTVTISFSEGSAAVEGNTDAITVSREGAHVTIDSQSKKVEYIISGKATDGSLKIYGEKKSKIVLDGVELHNPHGAAINNQCGKSMYIVIAEGKDNKLSCGSNVTIAPGEDMKGAFFSEGQMIFSGKGTLTVESAYKNGIASDDYITIRPGSIINVSSSDGNAIKANDGVTILGSAINLHTTADGAKGINSEASIIFHGGRTTIINEGSTLIEPNDTTGCAAIKSDLVVNIKGGELNLKSTGEGGKCINANEGINISGGAITAVSTGNAGASKPKAIKSDKGISINGGSVYAYSAHNEAIDTGKGYELELAPKAKASTSAASGCLR